MITHIVQFLEGSNTSMFWVCAIVGTVLFILRMLLSALDGTLFPGDTDTDFSDLDHGDHDFFSFKILTLHSLAGFLMMFGWAGLACTIQFGFSYSISLLIALVCGACIVIVNALIFKAALLLESRGVIFSTRKTIGLTGIVYQRIAGNGVGKVHIVVDGIGRELLAQSHNKKDIASFARIKVVAALDYETVEVIEIIET